MAISKKSSSKKTTTAKAPAKKAAGRKPAARKASAKNSRSVGRIFQIDAGWFYILQDGDETGQVVVVGSGNTTVEYYFLYVSGTGPGKAPYTWPSQDNTPVSNTFVYADELPPGWTTPSKYQSNLYPIVAQLVTANCTTSSAANRATPRSKK